MFFPDFGRVPDHFDKSVAGIIQQVRGLRPLFKYNASGKLPLLQSFYESLYAGGVLG